MKCPYCGSTEDKVVDSRPTEDESSIRRRRECLSCHRRYTTFETVEVLPVMVVKRNGSRQRFDRAKLLNGMIRACEKRPVPFEKLEKATQEIEMTVQNRLDKEITSADLGEMVMEKLMDLDEVSYVRFASVYRQFKDINTFMTELEKIIGKDAEKENKQ